MFYFFYSKATIVDKVRAAKLQEIEEGVDGFMVYDLHLVPHIFKVNISVSLPNYLFFFFLSLSILLPLFLLYDVHILI